MSAPDPQAELRELCDRLLDGPFTDADRTRLEALVLGDPAQRRLYVQLLHTHAALRQQASRLGPAPLAEILRMEENAAGENHAPRNILRPRFRPRWLRLAAALAIGFTVWWFAPQPSPPPLAQLLETHGARWEDTSLPTTPGSPLQAGRLRLADGVARLRFQSGAEVSLEGPAELELRGPNNCHLHTGALTAHVPEAARGFTVTTAHARLVDHGTDFGISADATGRGEVQVLSGEVELQHGRTGETRRLATRESAGITPEHFTTARGTEGEPDRYAYLRAAADARPPTLTLTTAGGTGDATYVASPGTNRHFSDTLLLVKNAPDRAFRRKAILRFDLAPLHDRRVHDAALTLNLAATGFGYASLTGACTFAVYGITTDAQDAWTPETLTWENAPAFAEDAGSADPAHAVKLGTFTTSRGVVSGTYSITGQALSDFLNADVNRRATLLIVRENSDPTRNSAVHGIAGNRHPTLAPPTLRLTLE